MRKFMYFSLNVILLVIIVPFFYRVPFTKPPGPVMDGKIKKDYQKIINQTKPAIIIIGDSNMDYSVNEQILSDKVGKTTLKLSEHGSGSAIWYLIVKHNISKARHKPDMMVIFFRGSMITTPEFRTKGANQSLVDEFAGPGDQLFLDLAYGNHLSWLEKKFSQYIPPYAYRNLIRDSIERIVRYSFVKHAMDITPENTDIALATVLDDTEIEQLNDAISSAEQYLYQSEKLDFESQLPRSFLPAIIELCENNQIQLVFVRPAVPFFLDIVELPETVAYTQALDEYLVENEVMFLDFAFDARITKEHFQDSLHMTSEGQKFFSEILAESLKRFVDE